MTFFWEIALEFAPCFAFKVGVPLGFALFAFAALFVLFAFIFAPCVEWLSESSPNSNAIIKQKVDKNLSLFWAFLGQIRRVSENFVVLLAKQLF